MKYIDTKIVFSEVPDEITLAINIRGCLIHCADCHSKYLWEDKGNNLDDKELLRLIKSNSGITCVSFMGGDDRETELQLLAKCVKENTKLKVAWYSGRSYFQLINFNYSLFDYVKIGDYRADRGPLNNPNTNQKMFKLDVLPNNFIGMINITNKFWKQNV